MRVPKEFYNEDFGRVKVKTVGELIEQLGRLPKDMKLQNNEPRDGAILLVYNHGSRFEHLAMEELDY